MSDRTGDIRSDDETSTNTKPRTRVMETLMGGSEEDKMYMDNALEFKPEPEQESRQKSVRIFCIAAMATASLAFIFGCATFGLGFKTGYGSVPCCKTAEPFWAAVYLIATATVGMFVAKSAQPRKPYFVVFVCMSIYGLVVTVIATGLSILWALRANTMMLGYARSYPTKSQKAKSILGLEGFIGALYTVIMIISCLCVTYGVQWIKSVNRSQIASLTELESHQKLESSAPGGSETTDIDPTLATNMSSIQTDKQEETYLAGDTTMGQSAMEGSEHETEASRTTGSTWQSTEKTKATDRDEELYNEPIERTESASE